jgi:hypothetical protein
MTNINVKSLCKLNFKDKMSETFIHLCLQRLNT